MQSFRPKFVKQHLVKHDEQFAESRDKNHRLICGAGVWVDGGIKTLVEASSGGRSCFVFSRSSRNKSTWIFLLPISLVDRPWTAAQQASSLQRSTWNLWPIFYYYFQLFFVLFCYELFLSSFSSVKNQRGYRSLASKLKIEAYHL